MLVRIVMSCLAILISSTVNAASAPAVIAKPVLTTQEKIVVYANKYNASAEIISNVINCESSFNPNAVGDNGNSFGLSQIYLPAHPNITKEQALNEDFAIEFMAKNINKNPHMWSCYNIIYG